jgi:hypothetical protein
MATITGLLTVNGKQVIEVDANPASFSGTEASIGSIALFDDGSVGSLYVKTGAADTAWTQISTFTAEDAQDAVGAILTNTANINLVYNDAGNEITADLTNTGVVANSYGSASQVATFTVDQKGRLSAAATTAISITATQVSDFNAAADARITAQKGQPNGLATLDATGKVPAAQLPSYVDDVLEFANLASFPVTGELGVIYVALDTNKTYRWSGSVYIEISPSEVTSVFGRSGAVSAQAGDYNASQITNTPAGNISSVTVQAALNELDAEKQPLDATLTALAAFNSNGIVVQTAADTFTSRSIVSGTGITVNNGDGVAANPSIAISNTGVSAASYGSASQVATFTVNAQGQLTAAASTSIAIPSTQVTDFNESAQDAVGNSLVDSSTIDFTYNDGANTITAEVIQSGIDHGSISGLSDDDHAQYALLAGRAGGQSLTGGTASANNLTLSSTSNATKGKINLGTSSAYDEANVRLGLGSASPETILHIEENNVKYNVNANSTTTSGAVNAVVGTVATSLNSAELVKFYVTGLRTNGANESVAYERTLRIKNNGGTVTILNVQSDYTSEDGALNAATVAPIVNGSSVDIRVTGVASANITWKVVIHRIR